MVASDPHMPYEAASSFFEVHLSGGPFEAAGAGFVGLPAAPWPMPGKGAVETVLFVEQPGVPPHDYQRAWLARRLYEYAERHPARRVLVKLRVRPGERATHKGQYPFRDLCREAAGVMAFEKRMSRH